MFFGIDPVYFLFIGPGILFSLWASYYVKSTFSKYSEVMAASGLTGAEAARRMLDVAGVHNVKIEYAQGFLGDHYDPLTRTLRLSQEVHDSPSLASVGVACHEAGHALQHAEQYAWLGLRSALVPATNVGRYLSWIFVTIGMLFHRPQFILLGAAVFGLAVLFSVITLPVEWNASVRARVAMVRAGIVTVPESDHAWIVLRAAFLTYVAAAVTAVLTLLYYLWRAGVFGGGRRD